jgi:hypothetical protein
MLLQLFEGLIESEQLFGGHARWQVAKLDVRAFQFATMFGALFSPGILNEDSPHRLGGGGKEVAAAVPVLCLIHIDQTQVGIMHEGRGLESLPGFFLDEMFRD